MKMKVGEIEFDSESSISFEARAQPTRGGPDGSPTGEERLDRIDRKARKVLAIVGMFLTMLTGALVLVGILVDVAGLIALGGFALLSAMSCLVAYFGIGIKAYLEPSAAPDRDEGADQLLQTRVSKLREHLTGEPATVDRLLERTGWTEAALLPALAQLVADGEVDEDLDLDSGAWTYRTMSRGLLSSEPPRHTLSLDDRIASVSSDQIQSQTHKKDR